jgi:hypothetical protein
MAIGKPRPVAALRHNWVTSPTAFRRSITGQRNGISDRGCWRHEVNRRSSQGATLTVRAIAFRERSLPTSPSTPKPGANIRGAVADLKESYVFPNVAQKIRHP